MSITQVTDYLGTGPWQAHDVVQIVAHLGTVTAAVRAYTRGQGFIGDEPAEDLAAVIVTATARGLSNPDGIAGQTVGQVSVRYADTGSGWTLTELAILNGHRRRAA